MNRKRTDVGIWLALATLILTGCESMHLHDPGRLKAATDATEIAKEFSDKGTAVFEPMEENLDTFTNIEQEIAGLLNQHELETFFAVVATDTADKLAEELADTMRDWTSNIGEFDSAERLTIENVAEALERGELAQALLKNESDPSECLGTLESTPSTESIDKLLCRLQGRLKQMQKSAKLFIQTFDKVSGLVRDDGSESTAAGVVTKMDDTEEEKTALIRNWIGAASDALDSVDKDEQLKAARNLLAATVEEQLNAESKRIREYQRYLGEIRQLRQTFDVRERVAVCQLFTPAFYRLLPGLSDPEKHEIVEAYEQLASEERYAEDAFCAFADIRDSSKNLKINANDRADWGKGKHTLTQYLAANISRLGEDAQGAEMAAAMGILAFVERPFLDEAVNQLYVERTRHSLRLSKINAQQRADLIRDIASGLEIYEQGGIKPEEIARLALFASQVGGLFYIGTQN